MANKNEIVVVKQGKITIHGNAASKIKKEEKPEKLQLVSNEEKAAYLWNEGKVKDRMQLIGEFATMPIKFDKDASEISGTTFSEQFPQPTNTICVYKDQFDHYWAFPKASAYDINSTDFFHNIGEIYEIDPTQFPRNVNNGYKIGLETATELEIDFTKSSIKSGTLVFDIVNKGNMSINELHDYYASSRNNQNR